MMRQGGWGFWVLVKPRAVRGLRGGCHLPCVACHVAAVWLPCGCRVHGPVRQSLAGVGPGEKTGLSSQWPLSAEAVEGTGLGQGMCCVEDSVGKPPSSQ